VATELLEQLFEQIKRMPADMQQKVYDYTHALAINVERGTPGVALLSFAGSITLEDAHVMSQAIEDGCEHVDSNDW